MSVVHGPRGPLLVACDGSGCFALDNRCPHLGFPLHRGSVAGGILTCHWHHARVDLASGGEVWVAAEPRYADGDARWKNRLRAGLEHNLGSGLGPDAVHRRAFS